MTTSSHCKTDRTYYPLSITRRELTSLSIHVVQKITIIPAQKIGKSAVWNLILCSCAIWRQRKIWTWVHKYRSSSIKCPKTFLTYISHTAHVIDIGWTGRLLVRLSVCPSHAGIVSKWLNLSSNCLHCLVAHDSSFLRTKFFPEFQWEHPKWGH